MWNLKKEQMPRQCLRRRGWIWSSAKLNSTLTKKKWKSKSKKVWTPARFLFVEHSIIVQRTDQRRMEKLSSEIRPASKRNFELEKNVLVLDKQIQRLIQNIISLQDVAFSLSFPTLRLFYVFPPSHATFSLRSSMTWRVGCSPKRKCKSTPL